MLTRFLAFLNTHQLLPPEPVLVAVSGGLDSVVLADLLHRAGVPMGIAHVNFGLRGDESGGDEAFVRTVAERYGVDFHLFTPEKLAVTDVAGQSVQMAARELRYDFFARTADAFGYGAIATAHHRDDLAETLLLNLTRGTGLAGLHGIRPRRGCIVRPLLFTDRAEIAAYAHERGLRWREDSSNATDSYARNRLRHHVLPVLRELNPTLSASMTATADRLRAAEVLMRQELARAWTTVMTETNGQILLDKHRLAVLPEPAFRLGEWLRPFGFIEAQAHALAGLLPGLTDTPTGQIGQVFRSATHQISNDRAVFTLAPIPASPPEPILLADPTDIDDTEPVRVALPGVGQLTLDVFPKPTGFVPPTDPGIACLDADALGWPLTLRLWQVSDRFRPLGMTGHKLVSDLLNDRKLSTTDRANTWVLVSANGQIAWVVGHRLAHDFGLSAVTKRVARLLVSPIAPTPDVG